MLIAVFGLAKRITRLLESIALGTVVLAGAAAVSASAAFTGADSIMAQAAANAVRVANFGALLDVFGWLMAFIKIVTLFI